MSAMTDAEFNALLNKVFEEPVHATYVTEYAFRRTYQAPSAVRRLNRSAGLIAGAPRSAIQSAGGLSTDDRDLLEKLVAASRAQTKKWWLNEA